MTSKKKNYYKVLGVSPKAAMGGIRQAYREKAKRHHPDRAGEDSTARFQEISEAYEVLSSPEKRQEYDRNLEAEIKSGRHQPRRAGHRVAPEPLVPRREHSHPAGAGYRVPLEEIFEGFRNGETSGLRSGSGELEFEIYLNRGDAVPGSIIEFDLPIHDTCRFCEGSGRDWVFPCIACRGSGLEISSIRLSVRLPKVLRDGSCIELPLRAGCFDPGRIRLIFRVS